MITFPSVKSGGVEKYCVNVLILHLKGKIKMLNYKFKILWEIYTLKVLKSRNTMVFYADLRILAFQMWCSFLIMK